jgi:hypothetical protein
MNWRLLTRTNKSQKAPIGCIRSKKCQLRVMYPETTSFKIEGKVKILPHKDWDSLLAACLRRNAKGNSLCLKEMISENKLNHTKTWRALRKTKGSVLCVYIYIPLIFNCLKDVRFHIILVLLPLLYYGVHNIHTYKIW